MRPAVSFAAKPRRKSKSTKMVVITKAENGSAVSVAVGDTVELRLIENPTTGYRWKLDSVDNSALQPKDSKYQGEGSMPGQGGTRVFTFTALKTGRINLSAKNIREWEGEGSAIDRFQATVEIK